MRAYGMYRTECMFATGATQNGRGKEKSVARRLAGRQAGRQCKARRSEANGRKVMEAKSSRSCT